MLGWGDKVCGIGMKGESKMNAWGEKVCGIGMKGESKMNAWGEKVCGIGMNLAQTCSDLLGSDLLGSLIRCVPSIIRIRSMRSSSRPVAHNCSPQWRTTIVPRDGNMLGFIQALSASVVGSTISPMALITSMSQWATTSNALFI